VGSVARCFVAVWPSSEVVSALAALPRPAFEGARWTTQEQWHVTLRFFGDIDPEEVGRATAALASLAGSLPDDLTAQGGPGTRFLGPGLVVWPVEGLQMVAKAVERATAKIGQPVPERPFFGHMTIARGRRGVDLRPARHLLTSLSMSWPVTSLSLVQSELHPHGARYRDMEKFSAQPPVAPQ
jgi:RNA 2',3'-cyclic 3'-phosphodiesterase